MAEEKPAEGSRFFAERTISTVFLSCVTAAALWAGSTVVQSRQDNAVLLSRFENLTATVNELKSDVRELRGQMAEAYTTLKRAQTRLERLEPGAVAPYIPPGYTAPDRQPWRGDPPPSPPGPNQGGR